MKKYIALLIILACTLFVPVTAFAADSATSEAPVPSETSTPAVESTYQEEPDNNNTPNLADGEAGRGSIEAPDKYWGQNGYPDDVSFAYEAGGEELKDGTFVSWWEIGIVNADESRKQDIIDMISPDCIITFINCKYSYSQRETAYNEILNSGDDNIHGAVMMLNSEVVLVEISDEHMKEYAAEFVKKYGSFVVVTNDINAAQNDTIMEGGGMDKDDSGSSLWVWMILAILLIAAAFFLFFNRTRLIPAMQTTKGTIVTQSAPVSRKQTIKAIKKSAITPSSEVLYSILRKIDKTDR
jgi:hypothetical protein